MHVCPFNRLILAAEKMSSVNVDLYLKDELEFEVRSQGSRPQGDVASLRKQLRELIAAGSKRLPDSN